MSAHWRSSNTITTGSRRREPLEEGPPRGEELVRPPAGARLDAEQGEQRRLDPAPLLLVRDVLGDGLGDPRAGRRLVVRLERARRARGPSRRAPRT